MSAILLTTDLMIVSHASGAASRAGCTLTVAASDQDLLAKIATAPVNLVVLDLGAAKLDVSTLVQQLQSLPTPPRIVAFGPHVHAAKLEAASQAGCDAVISRGQFHAQAEEIFRQGG